MGTRPNHPEFITDYETVAASQTAQALGPTGAGGDILTRLVIVPATTGAAAVDILNKSVSITAATKANPVVITAAGHKFNNGESVYIADTGGMTEIDGNTYTVASATATTFALSGVDGTGYTTYTSGGTAEQLVNVFVAGTLSDLTPIPIELGIRSQSSAWKVTTGANVSVLAIGSFT